jgi:hypothetical protein
MRRGLYTLNVGRLTMFLQLRTACRHRVRRYQGSRQHMGLVNKSISLKREAWCFPAISLNRLLQQRATKPLLLRWSHRGDRRSLSN